VKLSRPAPSKLVIKISKCSAPDVIEARFQLPGKLTISHATPFKVKFTTCKVVKKKTWDCHFGGGLPSGPSAKPVTATLTLAAVGVALGAEDGYLVIYAVYSDGARVKAVARIPVAH
jgi:hypothetical protein